MKILKPSVRAALIGVTVNLLVGLPLVVGWPIKDFDGYGFYACPMVTTSVEWCMMLFMAYNLKTMVTENDCWPDLGWSMKNIEKDLVKKYLTQYVPMALSIASDFWRVAAIGAVCTTLGPI
jgi:hypothetical protein